MSDLVESMKIYLVTRLILHTIQDLDFWTLKMFAVITLKFTYIEIVS